MIGFNRRFAPATRELKRFFEEKAGPKTINYRVNAGSIPANHWTQDLDYGGGRIIGEVCHFVDMAQYLTDSRPSEVYATATAADSRAQDCVDNVAVTIRFADGSVCTISYLASGDPSLPKERIEVFGGGSVGIIDDFRTLRLCRDGRQKARKVPGKGYAEEVAAFIESVKTGAPSPIEFDSIVSTSLATFRIGESLRSGVPVRIGHV